MPEAISADQLFGTEQTGAINADDLFGPAQQPKQKPPLSRAYGMNLRPDMSAWEATKEGFKAEGRGLASGLAGIGDVVMGTGEMLAHPVRSLLSEGNREISEGKQAYRSLRGGKYADAAGHALAINPLEPPIENAINTARKDPSRAVGQAIGAMLLGEAAKELPPAREYPGLSKEGLRSVKEKVGPLARRITGNESPVERSTRLATSGKEDILTGAAPTALEQNFPKHLDTFEGDLKEIGRKAALKLEDAKRVWGRGDKRVAATKEAIQEHLDRMYEEERAPQISRHSDKQVYPLTGFSADAKAGLEHLANHAGKSADRALAQKALSSNSMTMEEFDRLAILTNKELLKYEMADPSAKSTMEATQPKIGSLKPLDRELGVTLDVELKKYGEPGIREYEQRSAAGHRIAESIGKRDMESRLTYHMPFVDWLRSAIQGSPRHLASASQAAIADVNIGSKIQKGLGKLSKSEGYAKRPGGSSLSGPTDKTLVRPPWMSQPKTPNDLYYGAVRRIVRGSEVPPETDIPDVSREQISEAVRSSREQAAGFTPGMGEDRAGAPYRPLTTPIRQRLADYETKPATPDIPDEMEMERARVEAGLREKPLQSVPGQIRYVEGDLRPGYVPPEGPYRKMPEGEVPKGGREKLPVLLSGQPRSNVTFTPQEIEALRKEGAQQVPSVTDRRPVTPKAGELNYRDVNKSKIVHPDVSGELSPEPIPQSIRDFIEERRPDFPKLRKESPAPEDVKLPTAEPKSEAGVLPSRTFISRLERAALQGKGYSDSQISQMTSADIERIIEAQ